MSFIVLPTAASRSILDFLLTRDDYCLLCLSFCVDGSNQDLLDSMNTDEAAKKDAKK
jgi:hypothetical protein